MRLIAEIATSQYLVPILDNLQVWKVKLNSVEWVGDIKSKPFTIYRDSQNGQERRVILPLENDVIFVYLYGNHAVDTVNFAGATLPDGKKSTEDDKISIIIFGNESQEVLELRLVHEILHAMELPADGLDQYASIFMPWWMHWYYLFLKWRRSQPEQKTAFQRRYYRWLLDQREKGTM